MNMGQTMITSGMFVLLVMSVISANRMLNQNTETTLQSEALELSASIAEDLIAEASGKLYDVYDNGSGLQESWEFGSCGPSSEENSQIPVPADTLNPTTGVFKSADTFSDFDDYNGYKRLVTAGGISGFLVKSYVYYIDAVNPDVPTSWQTYFKKMDVRISHPLYIVDKEGRSFVDGDTTKPVQVIYSSLMSY